MKFSLSLLVSFLSAAFVVAQDQSIVEIAAGNDDFTTLVQLLTDQMLVDTLSGDGPFTVFAPTNAAFEALGNATAGMTDDAIKDILLYHVASGSVTSDMLTDGMMVTMMNGANATIALDPVMINDATVTTPDLMASNGVIHVIDGVLLPPSDDMDTPDKGEDADMSSDGGAEGGASSAVMAGYAVSAVASLFAMLL